MALAGKFEGDALCERYAEIYWPAQVFWATGVDLPEERLRASLSFYAGPYHLFAAI